jgi:hypothetical protein
VRAAARRTHIPVLALLLLVLVKLAAVLVVVALRHALLL